MNICVFMGSGLGNKAAYRSTAIELGHELARRDIGLVYGGASVGLMGAVADAVLEHGGRATGVIPEALLDLELAHEGLDHLHVVSSMHERKAKMADLSDAFIVLPGGIGTMEEMFEIWTWSQLGIHSKPLGLLNVAGYYDGLTSFLDHMQTEGFVKPDNRQILISGTSPAELVEQLINKKLPDRHQWVEPAER